MSTKNLSLTKSHQKFKKEVSYDTKILEERIGFVKYKIKLIEKKS